jgi:hypothetical protein
MKTNRTVWYALASVMVMMLGTGARSDTQVAAAKTSAGVNASGMSPWSVQVEKVDPGDVNLDPAFRIAIYENLLEEMAKTKRFKQVFRSGDRSASEVPELLILKTRAEKYTPGSETRRAVTTVCGATKLRVHSQLCNRDGRVVLEWVVDGNVRFLGGNLRATHNLARNVANKIKGSTLPEPATAMSLRPKPISQPLTRQDS